MTEKRFALKAINDEETTCTICGKLELSRVMWIIELDSDGAEIGNEFHTGTTCGARLMGMKISKVQTAVKNFDHSINMKKRNLQSFKENELGVNELIKKLNDHKPRLTFAQRIQTEEWEKIKELKALAKDWASNQNIFIEIK